MRETYLNAEILKFGELGGYGDLGGDEHRLTEAESSYSRTFLLHFFSKDLSVVIGSLQKSDLKNSRAKNKEEKAEKMDRTHVTRCTRRAISDSGCNLSWWLITHLLQA